uniref:Photosystem I reaction center subunit III n=1 Tax=Gloeochaete wittrockiana TaxID=38269 RepID=A0A3G1IW47_9EUKA|nr:photosystem I subunit III [Gloeochaete wittrockiana]ASQ40284.1 photosystem I subunit III [Gloeochaete wittrockiana]
MRKLSFAIVFIPVLSAFLFQKDNIAHADVAGLTPCKDSAEFNKRLQSSVSKLQNRLKKYEANSKPALAITQQINKAEARFARYADQGLLCGADGLPHLIADGRLDHAKEFTLPGLFFIYIAGFIGWSGRSYLISTRSDEDSTEKEIIIDVPLALASLTKGFVWPLGALQEATSGQLTTPDENISVSPR